MFAVRRLPSQPVAWSWCVLSLLGATAHTAPVAQDRVYRCGDLYTSEDKSHDPACTPLAIDRITVVQVQPQEPKSAAQSKPLALQSPSRTTSTRVSSLAQAQKDSESRQILEAEWRKTRQRLQDLQSEYNRGEPERLGSERSNPQKYLDRVAALQSSIARTEADLTGIRRELARMGAVVQP